MEDQLINFNTAKLAKDKGFDCICRDCFNEHGHTYSNGWCEILDDFFEDGDFYNSFIESKQFSEKYFTRPTQSLLQKWLREVHSIHIKISLTDNSREYYWSFSFILSKNRDYNDEDCWDQAGIRYFEDKFNSFEKALEKGLFEALSLIK